MIVHCGLTGFVLLAYTLWVYHGDMDVARTMIVTVSVFYQMLLAINCASWQPAWKSWGNSTLWWSIVISLAMHIGLMYSFLGTYFSFTHLGLMDWAVVVILGLIGSLSVEVYKLVSRNKDAVKSKLKAGFKKPIL